MGGPYAAGYELGGSPSYGPWPWHCLLACYKRYRSACVLLLRTSLDVCVGNVHWHAMRDLGEKKVGSGSSTCASLLDPRAHNVAFIVMI